MRAGPPPELHLELADPTEAAASSEFGKQSRTSQSGRLPSHELTSPGELTLSTRSGRSSASASRKWKLDDLTNRLPGCVRWMRYRFEYLNNAAYADPFRLLSCQRMSRGLQFNIWTNAIVPQVNSGL